MSWKERAEFLMALVRADLRAQGISLSLGMEEIVAEEIALTDEDLAIAKARHDQADRVTVENLKRYLEYLSRIDETAFENFTQEIRRIRGKD
jgi:hypothetical protein